MSIRIIAGEFRGRRLQTVTGRAVRPTGDRVRETIFNMLEARGAFPCGAAVDLFAGSGALGIEALSRGAARAVFVERDAAARALLRENLLTLHLTERAEIVAADALAWTTAARAAVSLVFADPPYAEHVAGPLLDAVSAGTLLAPGGWCVIEHRRDEILPAESRTCARVAQRRFGETVVDVYSRDRATTSEPGG